MNKIKILIPIYNDWKSAFKLLEDIDLHVNDLNHEFSVIIVNDCSTEERPINVSNFSNLKSIKIVNMKKNRGHARSNATGLKFINEKEDFDYVIPMDGDGEDKPEELSLLFSKAKKNLDRVIVATRFKRSESSLFKFFYTIHIYLTFIFTGRLIKFGNYTFLPKSFVKEAVKDPDLWNSFVGTIEKLAKKKANILSTRGNRYFGSSKMNFINLVKHSLSMMSIFKKTLLIRSILFLIAYLFLIIGKISVITLIPVIGIIIMMISVIILSKRKNMSEFENSLENISNIDNIK